MKALIDYLYDLFNVNKRRWREESSMMRLHELELAKITAHTYEVEQRLELAKKATHEQTLELVEAVLSRVQVIATANNEGLIEVAKGIQENGKALTEWMDLFKQNQGPGTETRVDLAAEFDAEIKAEEAKLREMGYIVDTAPVDAGFDPSTRVASMFSSADRG